MPDPWFKFYSTEFLLDARVNLLTLQEQAIVVRMWCIIHQNGSIPNDPKQVSRLIAVNLKTLRSCWDHARMMFISCADHEPIIGGSCAHDEVMMRLSLTSARLDHERIKSEDRSNKFRQGANQTNTLRYGTRLKQTSPSVSPSVSPSDRPKEEDKEEEKRREDKEPPTPLKGEKPPHKKRGSVKPDWDSSLDWIIRSQDEKKPGILDIWPKWRIVDGIVSKVNAFSPTQLQARLLRLSTEKQTNVWALRASGLIYVHGLQVEEVWCERENRMVRAHHAARNMDRFFGLKDGGDLWESNREAAEAAVLRVQQIHPIPEVIHAS